MGTCKLSDLSINVASHFFNLKYETYPYLLFCMELNPVRMLILNPLIGETAILNGIFTLFSRLTDIPASNVNPIPAGEIFGPNPNSVPLASRNPIIPDQLGINIP